MDAPLDEQYLTWLYSKVASVKSRQKKLMWWNLLRQLYTKEFVWFIPNDDNRVEDGRDLRREFLEAEGIEEDAVIRAWLGLGCSVLELLIGVSRKLAFVEGGSARVWFWELIENLDLTKYNDAFHDPTFPYQFGVVDEKLNRLIWRTYQYDGSFGGLFPLREPAQDQRDIEIWYQLSAYLLER